MSNQTLDILREMQLVNRQRERITELEYDNAALKRLTKEAKTHPESCICVICEDLRKLLEKP